MRRVSLGLLSFASAVHTPFEPILSLGNSLRRDAPHANVRFPPIAAVHFRRQHSGHDTGLRSSGGGFWRALRFVVVDWTVTPRMLALNEQRPIVYQLVTTPVVTLVFGLIVGALIVGSSFLGIWPSR